jgi:hypothetical protein
MKVLTLSANFLMFHPRRGEPTGFKDKYLDGKKIHTVRTNSTGHWKAGDEVSIREWSGRPHRSPQVIIEDGVRIGIEHIRMKLASNEDPHTGGERIETITLVEGQQVSLEDLAKNDGLTPLELIDWFFPKVGGDRPKEFSGDIIHFTDYRYGGVNPVS